MKIAIDTEYNEVTKIPFIATLSDGETSHLLYPNKEEDWWVLKQICESSDYEKIFHSATSDMYAFYKIGINVVPPYHCTFIMSNIIDENFSSHKLKDLAKKYLNEPCDEAKELNKIKAKYKKKLGKDFRWSDIPKEVIEPYAVKDAEYTIALGKYFFPKLEKYESLYQLEIDLIPTILDMYKRGHKINRGFCEHEIKHLELIYVYYYNKLIKFYGKIFNLQSPKALQDLLKKAEIHIPVKTSHGMSTSKDNLELLVNDYPVIQWILNCRYALKQMNTYYEPLMNKYTSEKDSIAHFAFYQSGTKSGRFSAELIQTIPKEQPDHEVENLVRRAFIPRPGYVNFYFDYDQVEMKLFAHFTQNKTLIEAILNGLDTHEATAIEILGIAEYERDPKTGRRIAKTINFGVIYGMGRNALALKLGIPLQQANIFLSKYDQKYRIKSFISQMTSLLYRQGFIELGWINREYRVPKDLAYKSVNILIQGSAAYIIKLAMKKISTFIKTEYIEGVNMLIQMHDELIFEMHQSTDFNVVVPEIKRLMEDLTTFAVPITVSVDYSEKSWLDKKKYKLGVV